jgi:hypothetical protein
MYENEQALLISDYHNMRPTSNRAGMIAPAFSIAIAAAPPVAVGMAGVIGAVPVPVKLPVPIALLVTLPVGVAVTLLEVAVPVAVPVVLLVAPVVVLLPAEALDEEEPDPGVIKEPPEIPPEGTEPFALFAAALNAAKVLAPLGGFITATIPN